MAKRILPGRDVLAHWLEEGLTQQEMADRVYETTGWRVTRAAVSAALQRHNLTSLHRNRYTDELPWTVREEHLQAYPARQLRLLGRRHVGARLSEDESGRLDRWLAQLDAANAVVAYDPDYGFVYIDRHPSDPVSPPIRRQRVWMSPPADADCEDCPDLQPV